MSAPTLRLLPGAAAIAAVVAGLLVGVAAPADAQAVVPSQVLPGEAAGSEVRLRPPVLRAAAERAVVEVVLGSDAPGDVVVELSMAAASVTPDGTTTPGAPATTGDITRGGRLRPGEVLRATLTEVAQPLVVVAEVRPADGAGGRATTLHALVLPEPIGAAPEASLEVVDGQLRGTVRATAPVLVTARLSGATVTVHPERLVLPDQPLVVTGEPARWPVPSELAVTDDAGRTATVSTSRTALGVIAVVLVAAAAAGVAHLLRRRRAGPAGT